MSLYMLMRVRVDEAEACMSLEATCDSEESAKEVLMLLAEELAEEDGLEIEHYCGQTRVGEGECLTTLVIFEV